MKITMEQVADALQKGVDSNTSPTFVDNLGDGESVIIDGTINLAVMAKELTKAIEAALVGRPVVRLKERQSFVIEGADVNLVARCGGTKSVEGGSCSERVPCDGVWQADGTMTGGCGEPCSFVMQRVPTVITPTMIEAGVSSLRDSGRLSSEADGPDQLLVAEILQVSLARS